MSSSPATPSVVLRNGETVKVNDHVYCSPSWSVRDGTPYSIARIMEFLPPQGTPTFDASGKRNEPFTRVRLAWYYRPGDVSDRPVADSRLLLAAIYSEVCDLNQLRAKCYVMHRDKISDLAGWKKRPDRFYFTRLFDPWIRKEFEVIQAISVRNLPEHIREVLISRYEYVVAEKEIVPDLTDELRTCATCEKWCPPPESVQCDRCKMFFHMSCVSPPLLSKPSRGYGWTCAPCSRQHEEEVEGHEVRHITPAAPKPPKSNAPAPRGRGRPRKDRVLAEKEENVEIRHFKMWPFRYFGQYTVAEDTLDPDDFIFPRAATRVGQKYQVSVLPIAGAENPYPPGTEERGGDDTIEVLSHVNQMSPDEVAAMEAHKSTLTRNEILKCNVDFLTEAIRRFTNAWLRNRDFATVNMATVMRTEKWKKDPTPYIDTEWTRAEKAAFENTILTHGAELRLVRDEVGTRSIAEVVRYYAHWKNEKLGEENKRIKEARASGREVPDRPPSRAGSEDDSSIVTEPSKGNNSCGACRTRESEVWWKAPKGLVTNVLCDNCGISWRKYADLNVRPFREEPVTTKGKGADKREGTPLNGPSAKRTKTSASVRSTPPPAATGPQRCLACHRVPPANKILRCRNCQFRAHAGVIGATADLVNADNWLCDLCQNEKTQEFSVNYDCLLCPRSRRDPKKKQLYPPADSYLRSCKPTEGQAWVHSLCSVFIPEIQYSDASRLRLVEGISTIPLYRWMNNGGAVVRCSDCPAEYHVSCAWKAGHKFGFEMQPVKSNRRDSTTVIDFREYNGCMVPVVTCKGHPAHRRETYDMCDANDTGETALQVYCKNYKQAPLANTHGLLRKARRLDQVINTEDSVDSESTLASGDMSCWNCGTEYSPCFYSFTVKEVVLGPDEFGEAWECHACHMKQLRGEVSRSVNGDAAGPAEPHAATTAQMSNGVNGLNGLSHAGIAAAS
ncbi:hypothetical protein K474DRAFT_1712701 [Panus rudis PR-1116 ss-1]|nr:hypothetical protein K474DRAFT_1712701 [Panus rudis PR-1116 ss-1]